MDQTPIQRLQSGDVPRMVGWYEPRLLLRVGIRTIISAVFGQYADQRLIQAATDVAPIETIVNRYNYSDVRSEDPERRVALGENGAFWVDYIADIGDGTGYFTKPLAKKTGPKGEVLAVDIQPEMIELLTNQMAAAGINIVAPISSGVM